MEGEDADAEAEMRETMGFANFGAQKKADAAEPSKTKPGPTGSNTISLGSIVPGYGHQDALPEQKQEQGQEQEQAQEDPAPATSSSYSNNHNHHHHHQQQSRYDNSSNNAGSQIGYTHPTTQISFTQQELRDYGRGAITNDRGDTVFFKPSFVVEDPWRQVKMR